MSSVPVLYTPRLRLRPFCALDAGRVRELAGDRRIAATTLHVPHPYPEGAAEAWIGMHGQAAAQGKAFNFAVTLAGTRTPGREHDLTDTGHVIGCVSVGMIDAQQEVAELGYWIGVSYWSKGFATEAARSVIDFAFARRGVQKIFARHFALNPASGQVLKKLGLKMEGVLRQHTLKWDQYQDVACYGMLREEWAVLGRKKRLGANTELQTA